MKKLLAFCAFVAMVALAACSGSYDYYKGDVRYVQDGEDCIYSSGENANNYSRDIDAADLNKKIVYRNTRCADLYANDMAGQEPRKERRVLTPAAYTEPEPVMESKQVFVKPAPMPKKSCKCCNKKKTTKQYVVVSEM